MSQVITPDSLARAKQMIRQKLLDGRATTYELEIIARDGRIVPLEISSRLICQNGKPVGIQGIGRDITDRRRIEAELRVRARQQAAVAELGQRALAGLDLQSTLEDAVSTVALTLGVEFCMVSQLLPDGQALLGVAGTGWRQGTVGAATIPTGPDSQAGYALLAGEPVVAEDLSLETRFAAPRVLKEHGIRSGMSVIIHGQERPFGTLSAFATAPRGFSRDDVHFLQAVANVVATAIDRKRLEEERTRHSMELATRVLQAQEEERKRIARELHDETAQALSTLLVTLDVLEPHIPADATPLQDGFARVRSLARRTLDETRALSHDLRPTILDDVGLISALQWFAAEYERTYGRRVEVHARPETEERPVPEVELALFRIAQEALTNCGKYAEANRVSVSLTFDCGAATLVVEDDGRGFDPGQIPGPSREGRLGLYGMHERIALLGGELSIATAPGQGTRITATIPLTGRPAGHAPAHVDEDAGEE
jgi:signal transduction histidine kinase